MIQIDDVVVKDDCVMGATSNCCIVWLLVWSLGITSVDEITSVNAVNTVQVIVASHINRPMATTSTNTE